MRKTNVCQSERCYTLLRDAVKAYVQQEGTDPESSKSFALRYLESCYLSKYNSGDRTAEAARSKLTEEKWFEAERLCWMTNRRLEQLMPIDPLWGFVQSCRSIISGIIGRSPPSLKLLASGRWSGGATFRTKRGAHFTSKQTGVVAVTHAASRDAVWWLGAQLRTFEFEVVPGNRCVQVPKSSKVNRMISIEPAANCFMQQAVGRYIRDALKRKGICDLDDQTVNQDAAFRAAVDGLATLDLSMASDTMCYELVRLFLPPAWFSLLDSLRSPRSRVGDKWVYLEKFSSMGNAFTFELESMIFYAICQACDHQFKPIVYGDDLVVRQESAQAVIAALAYFGFKVNEEKSFSSGVFFESCGKHFYELDDVTPAYQKEPIVCVRSAMRAHNRLIRWAIRCKAFKVVRHACKHLRTTFGYSECLIPYGTQSDFGWLVHPALVKTDQNGDYVCRVLKSYQKPNKKHRPISDEAAYYYKLYRHLHSNEDPKGYVDNIATVDTHFVTTSVVWASTLALE